MKRLITAVLKVLARIKLKRTEPIIIGVTGSYGKTTMKEVIATVMAKKYRVLKSEKSLNTDIGMCLAILEQHSGFSNPVKWIVIVGRAIANALFGEKAQCWVLEYGVDTPGDMDRLLAIARPTVAIVTTIAPVHLAKGQFESLRDIAQEKIKLARAVKHHHEHALVILNQANNELQKVAALRGAHAIKAPITWYNSTEINATTVEQTEQGIRGVAHYNGVSYSFSMPVVGEFHSDCALVATILSDHFAIPLTEVKSALATFIPAPGRMSLIAGIGGSTIIDSTYNASPETVSNAVKILKSFPAKRRIAVLGTMNELGDASVESHNEVAHELTGDIDVFVGVGEGGSQMAKACLSKSQKPSIIETFQTAAQAAEYVASLDLEKGDVILLKGSQNKVRLERAVKALMAHPQDAPKLLCRQEKEWEKKI